MNGGVVIRQARRRARLTQRELARRLHTSQSVVARWEAGTTSPSYSAVSAACRACGFDLDWQLRPRDPDAERVLHEQLRRTPAARVQTAVNLAAFVGRRA